MGEYFGNCYNFPYPKTVLILESNLKNKRDISQIVSLELNISMQAGNLNAEDDFENDYLRYGGAVGVRNPRLVRYFLYVFPIQDWWNTFLFFFFSTRYFFSLAILDC